MAHCGAIPLILGDNIEVDPAMSFRQSEATRNR